MYESKEQKTEKEKDISEFNYKSSLNWRFMKKLKSNTQVRAWHIKVGDKHYRLIQNRQSCLGEMLTGYNASKGGSVTDYKNPVFVKSGENWLHGVEYLLRTLEGQDISKLKLS
jgi:outer membrane receptor for ferrienterochelin and colicin